MDDRSQNKSNRRRIALLPVLVAGVIALLLVAGVAVTRFGQQSSGSIGSGTQGPDASSGGAAQQGARIGDEGNPGAGAGNPGAAGPDGQGGQGPGNPKNPGGPQPPWWTNPTVPIIDVNNVPPVKPTPKPYIPQATPPPGKDKAKV